MTDHGYREGVKSLMSSRVEVHGFRHNKQIKTHCLMGVLNCLISLLFEDNGVCQKYAVLSSSVNRPTNSESLKVL